MMWRRPTHPNGIIRHYRIEYLTTNDVSNATHVDVDGSALDFRINGLRPFTQYILRVAAFTVTLGNYSNEIRSLTKEASK